MHPAIHTQVTCVARKRQDITGRALIGCPSRASDLQPEASRCPFAGEPTLCGGARHALFPSGGSGVCVTGGTGAARFPCRRDNSGGQEVPAIGASAPRAALGLQGIRGNSHPRDIRGCIPRGCGLPGATGLPFLRRIHGTTGRCDQICRGDRARLFGRPLVRAGSRDQACVCLPANPGGS
jgi:hypothetical protein